MNIWKESQVGKEVELAYGKSLPAHARQTGDFGVYGSNGRIDSHSSPLVTGPGIVIGRKGSLGKVVYADQDFWPIDTTYYVVNKNDLDWRYLYHLLSFIGLDEFNSHSAVPGLNREIAYSIPVSLPEKQEQEQIAFALDTIEHAVRTEELAIEQSHELKRAAMQTLFTRGLRGEPQKHTDIGPVPESWEPTTVTHIATVKGGKRMPKGVSLTSENTGQPYIRVTDFTDHGVDTEHVLFVPKGYESMIARYTISSTDVYISIAGTIGLVGQIPDSLHGANLTENAAKLCVTDPNVDARFLMYALASETCQTQISAATGRNAQPKLALARTEQIKLPLPPNLDEQRDIVAILDAIDRKINLHRRKRATLDDLFKSLLHQLMTGELSVSELDLAAIPTPHPKDRGRFTEPITEKGEFDDIHRYSRWEIPLRE